MEVLAIAVFILGLPRTLWFIPIFILLWYSSGASSGGESGLGNNFGFTMITISFIGICAWGVLKNIKRYVFRLK